jgi:Periplasmic binding protein
MPETRKLAAILAAVACKDVIALKGLPDLMWMKRTIMTGLSAASLIIASNLAFAGDHTDPVLAILRSRWAKLCPTVGRLLRMAQLARPKPPIFGCSGSASIIATLKPAGLEKSNGVITAVYGKDPTDPRWKDDPGYRDFAAFVTKYMSPAQLSDPVVVYGFVAATIMTQVLKQCGDDLSRENILRQATNIRDFELPMGLPGTRSTPRPKTTFRSGRCNFHDSMARTGNRSAN